LNNRFPNAFELFKNTYDGVEWENDRNMKMQSCCKIELLNTEDNQLINNYDNIAAVNSNPSQPSALSPSPSNSHRYVTNAEKRHRPSTKLEELPEWFPPAGLPHGNVGTSTLKILSAVDQCIIPSSLLRRLGFATGTLHRNVNGSRYCRYGAVPPPLELTEQRPGISLMLFPTDGKYATTSASTTTTTTISSSTTGANNIGSNAAVTTVPRKRRRIERNDANGDNIEARYIIQDYDDAEDWERHLSLHGDQHVRNREAPHLYETPQEVVWEKGGSGLVFWTDHVHWDEMQGEWEDKEADALDVDVEEHEQLDRDAAVRAYVSDTRQRRLEQQRRQPSRKGTASWRTQPFGFFERHTTGFGSRLLRRLGWQQSRGLGKRLRGIVEPIEMPSQNTKSG
jgi:hypothetical protein